jgi:hypothetical protein
VVSPFYNSALALSQRCGTDTGVEYRQQGAAVPVGGAMDQEIDHWVATWLHWRYAEAV